MSIAHCINFPAPADFHFQTSRQSIDHRHADTVQTAGKTIILMGKLAAGMEFGQDDFDTGDAFLGVDIHRHSSTVVTHFNPPVREKPDLDGFGEPGQCLVHAVVDDFLRKMVGAGRVGVHARTLAHRVQAAQHFNGGGIILVVHRFSIQRKKQKEGVTQRRKDAT